MSWNAYDTLLLKTLLMIFNYSILYLIERQNNNLKKVSY